MNRDNDESYISDLTDRVFLIRSQFEAGKLFIASHLEASFKESFDKIRLRGDGKVDPATVDGRIRAMGVAVQHFFERNEIKRKYSIVDFQEAYFRILFGNFSTFYDDLIKSKAEPYQIANFLSQQDDFVTHVDEIFPDLYEDVKGFWATAYEIGEIHLQEGEQLKANFAGDLFPSYKENAVSSTGLYIDTIILPCPILRVGGLHGTTEKSYFCYLLMKHVLTCMTYRELALEEIQPAIALVLPEKNNFNDESKDELHQRSLPFILAHAHYLYDREFESLEHFHEFSSSLDDFDKLFKELKRPDRLLFDTEWGPAGRSQLEKHMVSQERKNTTVFDGSPGLEVMFSCMGRMPQALAARINAQDLRSTPYINAETSWTYYQWLIEYEALGFKFDEAALKDLHMVNALAKGMSDGFSWLGNIPMKNILEIRRNGLMPEVRNILSSGVSELINTSPINYNATSQKVIDNVDRAFIQHQRFLEKVKKEKLKILGVEVVPFIVNGAFGIASALVNRPELALASVVLGSVGLPTLKDIRSSFKSNQEKMVNYQKTATGLMFSRK
ncbi:hypothetical protein ACVR2H_002350 [Cronobacter sakazakii]|uniref:hypothetical protein n=2 Tax=Cronobacter sakazakii TaxID=28141 RepID=UPI000F5F3DE7|nr:hypothetical protein [Cronobacter sakazakii]EGT4448363.1 hypothetical protein [Cronobacter sakazakii]EGT4470609.1 hypothetical protein [Cronobacter sakazakii]ELY4393685.1 hypothetical protein [Cronobacter sakazakii]EMC4198827.1 hypothetical protein [Cronobacter sakazakii]EMC4308423.1 hypothetical protein [Cronobacter sakazakii]